MVTGLQSPSSLPKVRGPGVSSLLLTPSSGFRLGRIPWLSYAWSRTITRYISTIYMAYYARVFEDMLDSVRKTVRAPVAFFARHPHTSLRLRRREKRLK